MVDNGSTDNTPAIAKKFARNYPRKFKFTEENEVQSSYAARNRGIRLSSGEILCFVDADMTVEKDWLQKIDHFFSSENCQYVGCNVKISGNKETLTEIFNKLSGFPIEKYLKSSGFAPTCCLSVKRVVFDSVGFFDERLLSGGDLEFGNRVKEAGYRLDFDPSITMCHPARSNMNALLRKYFRVGRGFRQLWMLYPHRYQKFRPLAFIPRFILPPKPWEFAYRGRNSLETLQLYFVFWLAKFARLAGYLAETTSKSLETGVNGSNKSDRP